MSPDRRISAEFERRIGTETQVNLDGKITSFPISFTLNEECLTVNRVTAMRTEIRKSWRGQVHRQSYDVATDTGKFRIEHDLLKNSWKLVGKLRQ